MKGLETFKVPIVSNASKVKEFSNFNCLDGFKWFSGGNGFNAVVFVGQ